MSYEGYDQILCKNGHQFSFDSFDPKNPTGNYSWVDDEIPLQEKWKCPICDEEMVWWNSVDLTNGNDPETGHGYNYVELEIKEEVETSTCEHCGMTKIIKYQTYNIPKEGYKVEKD